MNGLTSEQIAIRDTAARYARDQIRPWHEADESQGRFRREVVAEMGALGFWGALVPETYGGTGAGFLSAILITEEIAKVSPAYAGHMITQSVAVTGTILSHGSEQQKRQYISALIAGHSIGCFAATEPNVGSDVASIGATALENPDDFVLNGTKNWITNAPVADLALVFARTAPRRSGISCFLVDLRQTQGVTIREMEKLGQKCAKVGGITFEDTRLPKNALIGKQGQGFSILMDLLGNTRLFAAARALGLASTCLQASLEYAKTRSQFGVPIGHHQLIQAQLAEMYVAEQAARAFIYKVARDKDLGKDSPMDVSGAKYFACETAVRAAEKAMRIYGAYGYSMEYPIQRYLRDAQAMVITEGCSNIQQLIIARHLLKA